jgi:hypothetical protein
VIAMGFVARAHRRKHHDRQSVTTLSQRRWTWRASVVVDAHGKFKFVGKGSRHSHEPSSTVPLPSYGRGKQKPNLIAATGR